ncbi:hypothetical protein [Psychrobacter sp. I-STPA6b]|uniref:hypothetical protein n=1 Tax=Psychrobacter sp. I-STPA6b TaxID=2585718 RepID=UPI001D0CD788|nr:hypothetical protein [Psychrobacter sp. I-STPA6b]
MKDKVTMLPTQPKRQPAGKQNVLSRFFADKHILMQVVGITILSVSAVMSMAFSSIQSLPHVLVQTVSNEHSGNYEGVVTFAGKEITLKTHERTYLVSDPYHILSQSQYFEKDTPMQSFRVCVEGKRSALGNYGKGNHPYLLVLSHLCH